MEKHYEELNIILENKTRLYDRLINVLSDEWKSVSEYSRERLEKILESKERLLIQIGEINQKRESLVRKMAELQNVPMQELTLKSIIQFDTNPFSMAMILHQTKLKEQIEKIKKLNAVNRNLIQRSAVSMKQSMTWIYPSDAHYTPYHADGQVGDIPLESGLVSTSV